MAALPSEVDPVEFPATYNWTAFDVRITMRYNEAHFKEIFDHQRQFYSS
jgi:Zn-dependent M32 family carboxypeptidase